MQSIKQRNLFGIYDVQLTAGNYFGSDNETKTGYIEIIDPYKCQKFEDDFNDNSINPIWWLKNGTWNETSSYITQTSNDYVSGNLLGGCFAVTGGRRKLARGSGRNSGVFNVAHGFLLGRVSKTLRY